MRFQLFTLSGVMAILFALSTQSNAQCSQIGVIGEFTDWSSDAIMDRAPENPAEFSIILTFTDANDTDGSGFIDLKFRQVGDWGVNWGNDAGDFPTGVGADGAGNIPVPAGTYLITFNCETGDYSFTNTCGQIGLIGEFTDWSGDQFMTRDANNPDMWSTILTLTAENDTDGSGFVDLKFRQDADWAVNWGNDAGDFPSGVGAGGAGNIPVPAGTYMVTFNCSTLEYNFTSTCSQIGLIGEFTDWSGDLFMDRSADNPNMWTAILKVTDANDTDGSGFVDLKFRQDADWAVNWGNDNGDFPSGVGAGGAGNIPVPAGIYFVTFNCSTLDYSFTATCGEVGMIGEFNNWNGDFPMNRDAANPNMWTTIKSLSPAHDGDSDGDIEVKFRQDADWTVNWGDAAFPSGVATGGGDNILAVAGTYDVSFNCATGAYNFATNDEVCGDIGMIGDFNTWGTGENGEVTDVNLIRDPNFPSQFSLEYTFASSTKLLFRENADVNFIDVWGGSAFPSGTGVQDNGVTQLDVSGGNYRVTFNCKSGDYNFIRLGSSVTAPKVFAIGVDGTADEADWAFSQNVSSVVSGEAGDDPVSGDFAVAYNDEYLYVAAKVIDGDVITGADEADGVMIFVDGNKNGGEYEDSDIYIFVGADGAMSVVAGNASATPTAAATMTADGYVVEASIAWADLGVTPESGSQIGFDLGIKDVNADGNFQSSVMWNGNAGNTESTSAFGDLLFGDLACGSISLFNDMIGDVGMHTNSDDATTYLATYEYEEDMGSFFRKDNSGVVAWGEDAFPTGNATVGGDAIPVTTGRYRVSFGCLDGAFNFVEEPAGEGVAYAEFTSNPVTIDGELSEYNLDKGMDAGIVAGTGTINNTVAWGATWDFTNLYLGVQVTDAVVEGSGNPWDNDAIEFYFDGNHDSDGAYDADFDTQLIMDALNTDNLWIKADGVPITDFDAKWTATDDGYNVELRLAWSNFGFEAGRNRTMGFTIGNNDSDNGVGRDYQSAWYGTGNNWNNTADHGDLQLAGGPLNPDVATNEVFYNDNLSLFPNPTSKATGFSILSDGQVFVGKTQVNIFNLLGQRVVTESINFDASKLINIKNSHLTSGTYFVHLMTKDGKQAVKKVIIE